MWLPLCKWLPCDVCLVSGFCSGNIMMPGKECGSPWLPFQTQHFFFSCVEWNLLTFLYNSKANSYMTTERLKLLKWKNACAV